jgi:exodeoxyribonuclease VII small subunit
MTVSESKSAETADVGSLPNFEESLSELQQIAHDLEEGSLGLEESLRRFERGITLLRLCYRTLEQAEQRIEILTGLDASGNAATAPFDASATVDPSVAPAAGRRKRARTRKESTPEAADKLPPRTEDAPPTDQDNPLSRLF